MTLKVSFRRAAKAEFDTGALWYEERQSGLGLQFVSEVKNAVELASNHPERFPVKYGEIRCIRVRRFPYSIYFLEEPSRIVVLAVFHAKRNRRLPGNKQARPAQVQPSHINACTSRGELAPAAQAGNLKLSPRCSTAQHMRAFFAAIATIAFQ